MARQQAPGVLHCRGSFQRRLRQIAYLPRNIDKNGQTPASNPTRHPNRRAPGIPAGQQLGEFQQASGHQKAAGNRGQSSLPMFC